MRRFGSIAAAVLTALAAGALVPAGEPTMGYVASAAASAGGPQLRILYASDWNGPMQIFAADPSGRSPVRQLTFARAAAPCRSPAACGFTGPLPSPDGRWLAYWSTGPEWESRTLWLARGDGTHARPVAPATAAAWAPDSRRLAYTAQDGIHVLSPTGPDRLVDRHAGEPLEWSPDGRALAFAWQGDLLLLRSGRTRVLVHQGLSAFAWAPDGRSIAYVSGDLVEGEPLARISVVSVPLGRARRLAALRPGHPYPPSPPDLAFTPNGRLLAVTVGGQISLLDTSTLRLRSLQAAGSDLSWSPDGRRLLYVQGGVSTNGDAITTGDLRTVTPWGRIQVVVPAAGPYGGQIVAAAWGRTVPGLGYRAPEAVDGVFAGGPVQELAADGPRIAVLACGGVSAWVPPAASPVVVATPGECRAEYSRGHVYSLGLAGDRLAWLDKGWGLCFRWEAHQARPGATPTTFGNGSGCLGGPPVVGLGTATGSGSTLVLSSWNGHNDGGFRVDGQTVERLEPDGTRVPLGSRPGPYTPLDVDAGRIVVVGEADTQLLRADGRVLLTVPGTSAAAQLSGADLVLARANELDVVDAASGILHATWTLPAERIGRDCDSYGDPACDAAAPLRLEDVAHGLAAYVVDGRVHLLRLADGADAVVAPATRARFCDAGLAYADGARVRLMPYTRLPLG